MHGSLNIKLRINVLEPNSFIYIHSIIQYGFLGGRGGRGGGKGRYFVKRWEYIYFTKKIVRIIVGTYKT